MIREELKQLKTGPRELCRFSSLVGGVLVALGVWFWLRGKVHFPWFLWPGLALLVVGFAHPRLLKPVYLAWMALALVMGLVVSNVLLVLFFLFVLTPVGLAARLVGKDFLNRKFDPGASTYWMSRKREDVNSSTDYERQF